MLGSIFSQGDHRPHWWKSSTMADSFSGLALMVAVRLTSNLSGLAAARPSSAITAIAISPRMIFRTSISPLLPLA